MAVVGGLAGSGRLSVFGSPRPLRGAPTSRSALRASMAAAYAAGDPGGRGYPPRACVTNTRSSAFNSSHVFSISSFNGKM